MVAPSWEAFQRPKQNGRAVFDEEEAQKEEYAQEVSGQIRDEQKPPAQQPQWGEFLSPSTYQGEIDPMADEGLFRSLLRGVSRVPSRLFEQGLGALGNIEKFSKDVLAGAATESGPIGWAISEYIGPERWERMVRGSPGEEQMFPTSAQIKDLLGKVTGGYTLPKTKGEERFDALIEDIGGTLFSRRGPRGTAARVSQHVLIPAAANVTKNMVDDLGFGENEANLAKMAVWLPLTLANSVNGPRYASDLMNRGRNGFNPNQTVNVTTYQNQLDQVGRNMLHGDPRSALARQQLDGIANDLSNGRTTMRDLMTRYDAINAAKRDRGLFQLRATDRRAAIRNINQVRDVVRDQIETLGRANPQALRDWQNGVQAWATIHRSRDITNRIQEIAQGPYAKILSGPAAALFGIGSYGAIQAPIVAGPLAAATAGSYKTGQILYRMWHDPNLSNYYWNAITGITEQNIPIFINNYNKLNKKLEEESDTTSPNSKREK